MKRVGHEGIAVIISVLLSIITAIVTTIRGWSLRGVYLLFFFFFFNLIILSLNGLIFSQPRRFIPEKIRKPLRITTILSYSLVYLLCAFSFAGTGQIYQIQTLLFLIRMGPLWISVITFGILFLIITLIILLIHKKTNFEDSKSENVKIIKILFFGSLSLFLITILINHFFLNIENDLIGDTNKLISPNFEQPVLEKLSKINESFNKPNVIFILLESINADRLGVYGYPKDVTPNMDKLANKSILFTNAYTTSTHSDYAQPAILSSRYTLVNKIRNIFTEENPRKFIWDIFKENGYATGYFSSQDDRWQGMNEYFNFENLDVYSYSMTDGESDYGAGYAQKDYDHKTAEKALKWINETTKKNESFFLYLNFQATHNPNAYPEEYNYFTPANEKINKYDNALRYIDEQIGEIINLINELNLTNKTIITITSDHGHDLLNRHDSSGHGYSIYQDELLVPAIAFIPNVEPTIVEEKVSHIDFVPTLIDLLGFEIPPEFQGDIMKRNRPIFLTIQNHMHQIGMIDNDLKVIIDMNKRLVEVYNLTSDPTEKENINSKKFDSEILKLLFWQYCQLDYYKKDKWRTHEKDRCSEFNNFRI